MTNEEDLYHIPVLLESAVEFLIRRREGIYVDATLGGGGHTARILQQLDVSGRVFGFDQDAEAIQHTQHRLQGDERFVPIWSNAVHLKDQLQQRNITGIDGILFDFGISSRQIDVAARGFSFQHDGPLDMRMNQAHPVTASDIVRTATRDELANIMYRFGEERRSRRIADAIVEARSQHAITTTKQLATIIAGTVPKLHLNKTLARVFQAFRIVVNEEMDVLERTLQDAFQLLELNGRIVAISYHSLEDRIVKNFFRHEAASCVCPPRTPVCVCGKVQRARVLTSKYVEPDENEIRRNPRSRSARLRACEKIHT